MKIVNIHLAIIMDGNGRWAQNQNKQRSYGHEAGAVKVREITTACSNRGITHLTLYAFSTENWKRPALEVAFLMKLMTKYLKNELPLLIENNIRFETIGDISAFSASLKKQIQITKNTTMHNTGLVQTLALNYGSRDEIIRALNRMLKDGISPTQENLDSYLDTASFPDVDMLIRTGGDSRLSNFLMWQAAYAELFFTPTLWPDFLVDELDAMLKDFDLRERRFGGIV